MFIILGTNIQAFSLHPGGVNTDLGRNAKGEEIFFKRERKILLFFPPSRVARGCQLDVRKDCPGDDSLSRGWSQNFSLLRYRTFSQ